MFHVFKVQTLVGHVVSEISLSPLGGVAAYVDHTLDAEVYKQLAVEFV